jgi:prepilin-type N-terminal cleavage/methylation domain-containing protein
VKKKFSISDLRFPNGSESRRRFFTIADRKSQIANGFTLIEVLIVVTLLSLIVVALMGVFTATQKAFRGSMTQTDVLEGGRATMDLITSDLKAMSPSFGASSNVVNFCVTNYGYLSLNQPLVANTVTAERTNIQENFFILSQGNKNGVPTWFATGYAVFNSPTNLYSLYRFSTDRPMSAAGTPENLFTNDFKNFLASPNGYSHLLDGVTGLRIRAFDANGILINTNTPTIRTISLLNISGEFGYIFSSNALPASVEIEMATLEDRTLQRASVWPNNSPSQISYLGKQAGNLHVFRQSVSIPNANAAANQ